MGKIKNKKGKSPTAASSSKTVGVIGGDDGAIATEQKSDQNLIDHILHLGGSKVRVYTFLFLNYC